MADRSDNFNRADSTGLGTPSDAGSAWTERSGVFSIVGNKATCTYVGANPGQAVLGAGSGDVEVSAVVAVWDDWEYGGLCAREADNNNYIGIDFTTSGYRLLKRDTGSYTILASGGTKPVATDVIKLRCEGTSLSAFINTTSIATATDGFNSTVLEHGLTAAGIGSFAWDDFSITDLGVAGDVTPPAVTAVSVDDTDLAITFTENVLVGSGGNGGFALTASGGAATLVYASGSGSGVLHYTVNRSIAFDETATLDYVQPGDGWEDAAGNDLVSFNDTTVTVNTAAPPLVEGTASFITSGPSGISIEATPPTGGEGAGPTCQWERSEDGGAFSDVEGATAARIDDITATTPDVVYRFRCKQYRGIETVTTNEIIAQTYSGGMISSGGPIYWAS